MRGKRRAIFYVVFGLLWSAVLCGGLELYEVLLKRTEDREVEAYTQTCQARGEQAQAAMLQRMDPEALIPPPPMPDTKGLADMDDAARSQLAIQRRELILVCSQDGIVRSYYVPEAPPEIAALAKRVHSGETASGTLFGPLPAEEPFVSQAQDYLTAIRAAWIPGGRQVRSYACTFEDGTRGTIETNFQAMEDAFHHISGVGVFIGSSMWEVAVFKYRKNTTQYLGAHKYHINNVGFRDDDVTLPKPPGVYRIVCIGASTTAEGYTNKLTYPSLLEARLRKQFGEDKIEVINCGVIGIHSDGEVKRIPDYLALQPDLIIHYNFINDTLSLFFGWVRPSDSSAPLLKRFKWLLRKSWFAYRHFNTWLWAPDAEFREAMRQTTVGNLRTLCLAAREAQVDVAVCSFAYPDVAHLSNDERRYYDACLARTFGPGPDGGRGVLNAATYAHLVDLYNDEVRALCRDEGFLYVPVAENLKGGTEYFYDACHCYLAGIDRKAEIVFEGLKDFVAARIKR